MQSVTDALGHTTSYVVDVLGRRIATRDPLGNVTLAQYDTNDRVTATTDALNQTTTQSYDGNGNLLTVTLPNQGVIKNTYDSRNRLITRTDAMNQSESWTYDGMNNVLTHTDRKGQVTQVSYDALNRRSLVSYADASGIQAGYDAGNRLTGLTDSISGSLSWGYDGLDRVTATSSPQGSVSYTYDAAGRRTGMTPAAQAAATYTYDNANRLTAITQGSETVQLAYDADNRRTTLTLPNGITVNYGYDNGSELTGLTYTQGNGTSLGTLAYGYDNDGQLNSKTNSITTDVQPTPTMQAPSFDLNDRETSFNGQALSYDADGNLTNDGTNTYTWDARNQLTQISQGSTVEMSYTYDAAGRRVGKAARGGVPTQFLYDGANAVQETQGSNANAILTGLGVDERFARSDVTGRTYFLTDALNSTIALTDPTGAIREQYSYDPYGNVTPSDTTTGFTNPYQYTGREADGPGLYYYRARYYSPMMGSFISEDPAGFAGGQLTFYGYAGGDPLGFNDPYGLWLPPTLPQGFVNGVAGFGDGIVKVFSFGFGDLAATRQALGIDGAEECGAAYNVGKYAGYAWGAGTMWAAGLNGGANSVFWSGYSQGARGIAEGLGTTLEGTPIGGAMDWLSNTAGLNLPGWAWKAASATFAANADGTATAVILSSNPASVWATVEAPILAARGIGIVFY